MAEFSKMILKDYGFKKRPITSRNPQANSIVEMIHQTIGNMICTFCIHETDLDKYDPWRGILGAVMCATRTAAHITNKITPAQLVFSHYSIFNFGK